jgi:hypothetical protein
MERLSDIMLAVSYKQQLVSLKRLRHNFYRCVFLLRMELKVLVSVVEKNHRIFKISLKALKEAEVTKFMRLRQRVASETS